MPKPRSLLIPNEPSTQDIGSSGTSVIASSLPLGLVKTKWNNTQFKIEIDNTQIISRK